MNRTMKLKRRKDEDAPTPEELQTENDRLLSRIRKLEARDASRAYQIRLLKDRLEAQGNGRRPLKGAAETIRASSDGGHEFVILADRRALAGDGELRALLEERGELITRIGDLRRKVRRLGDRLARVDRVATGRARRFPEFARPDEEEARDAWRELRAEKIAKTAELDAAERRVREIADTIHRGWVALGVARMPDLGLPTFQE